MGYIIAFAVGVALGSAVFCIGVLIGKGVKQAEVQPQKEPTKEERQLTEEEKADIERRKELERQFVALMEYSGRKRK